MAIELNLTKRTVTGKKVNNLRKTGVLPPPYTASTSP
jgi:hypothetical protein